MGLNIFTHETRTEVLSLNREPCRKLRITFSLRRILRATKPSHISDADWASKGLLDATLIAQIYGGQYLLCQTTMREAGVLDGDGDDSETTVVAPGYRKAA